MPTSRSRASWVIGGIFGSFIVSCLTCALVLFVAGPRWFANALYEASPHLEPTDERIDTQPIWEHLVADLRADRTTRLTGPELTGLLREQLAADDRGSVVLDGGIGTFDLSMRTAQGWVNVHAVGRFTMEDGRFTEARFDELDVSGWDLEAWLGEGPLVQQLNQQLDQMAAEDPFVAERLRILEHITIEDDVVVLTIAEDGVPYVRGPPTTSAPDSR